MPNWCYNEIEVVGENSIIKQMLEKIKTEDSDFDFNTIIPYPKQFADLDAKTANEQGYGAEGYNSGGYEWCIDNWGTKWGACEASVWNEGEVLSLNFDTAWSPSLPVTKALSIAFPELTFTHKYEEGGCDFSGYTIFKAGEEIENKQGEYDDYPVYEHDDFDDEEEEEDATD